MKVQYATSLVFLTWYNPVGKRIYRVNKLSYQIQFLVNSSARFDYRLLPYFFNATTEILNSSECLSTLLSNLLLVIYKFNFRRQIMQLFLTDSAQMARFVGLIKDLWIYGKNTQIVKYIKPVHNFSHIYIFFTWHESNTFPPKNALLH